MLNSAETYGFEGNTKGDWNAGTGTTLTVITSDSDTGTHALQAVTDATTFRSMFVQPTAGRIPIHIETMMMTIRVKAVTTPCTLDFTIGWYDASSVQIGSNVNYSPATSIGTTAWQTMTGGAINPPALSAFAVPSISIKEASSTVKFDSFVFDYMRLPRNYWWPMPNILSF